MGFGSGFGVNFSSPNSPVRSVSGGKGGFNAGFSVPSVGGGASQGAFSLALSAIAAPTYELSFAGDFLNTGSRTGAIATTDATATETSGLTGLTGFAQLSSTSGFVTIEDNQNFLDFTSGQDRSWIWVIHEPASSSTTPNGKFLAYMFSTGNFRGGKWASDGNLEVFAGNTWRKLTSSAYLSNPSSARTTGASSFGRAADKLKLLVISWNGSSKQGSIRHKIEGESAGHTVSGPWSATPRTSTAVIDLSFVGETPSVSINSDNFHEFGYFAIVDSQISDSDFDTLSDALGL